MLPLVLLLLPLQRRRDLRLQRHLAARPHARDLLRVLPLVLLLRGVVLGADRPQLLGVLRAQRLLLGFEFLVSLHDARDQLARLVLLGLQLRHHLLREPPLLPLHHRRVRRLHLRGAQGMLLLLLLQRRRALPPQPRAVLGVALLLRRAQPRPLRAQLILMPRLERRPLRGQLLLPARGRGRGRPAAPPPPQLALGQAPQHAAHGPGSRLSPPQPLRREPRRLRRAERAGALDLQGALLRLELVRPREAGRQKLLLVLVLLGVLLREPPAHRLDLLLVRDLHLRQQPLVLRALPLQRRRHARLDRVVVRRIAQVLALLRALRVPVRAPAGRAVVVVVVGGGGEGQTGCAARSQPDRKIVVVRDLRVRVGHLSLREGNRRIHCGRIPLPSPGRRRRAQPRVLRHGRHGASRAPQWHCVQPCG